MKISQVDRRTIFRDDLSSIVNRLGRRQVDVAVERIVGRNHAIQIMHRTVPQKRDGSHRLANHTTDRR